MFRNTGFDPYALACLGKDIERTAKYLDPFSHAKQAISFLSGFSVIRQSTPIVLYDQEYFIPGLL